MAPKVKEKVLAAARVTNAVVDGSQAIAKVLRKHTATLQKEQRAALAPFRKALRGTDTENLRLYVETTSQLGASSTSMRMVNTRTNERVA